MSTTRAQPTHQKPDHRDRLLGWLAYWLAPWLILLIPMLADFLNSKSEISAGALILPIVMNALIAGILALLFWRLFRRFRLAGFIAIVLMAIVLATNYNTRLNDISPILSAIMPLPQLGNNQTWVLSVIFLALLVAASWWLGRGLARLIHRRRWNGRDLAGAIMLAIMVTFAIQLAPTVSYLSAAWAQYSYKPPQLAALPASAKTAAKPDIYYIILDRYASPSVLQSQFHFSDSQFTDYLQSNGFTINANSHNNYPYTTMSVASTMSAGYLSDLLAKFQNSSAQTLIPYHRTVQYSPVAQALKNIGYHYDEIGNWYDPSSLAPLANNFYLLDSQFTLFNRTGTINNFSRNELMESVFGSFVSRGVHLGHWSLMNYRSQSQFDMTRYQLAKLGELAQAPAGGRFIFAHILNPHDPYYFNADGSQNPNYGNDNIGAPIKQKYLNQVQYINSQMQSLVKQINQRSGGQAVIIIQSDEGPYPLQLNEENFNQASVDEEVNDLNMNSWSDTDLAMKFGNFAAYHVPAASSADLASGTNNLNVFRMVFNSYFDAHLSYLPECIYDFPDGRRKPFRYTDITARLTGASNGRCAADGSGAGP